ncbi:MAG: hypothetical protein M3373_08860 [Gemmatimonadota bacterium]|nr:hypothetical protein [Gemmatimonadota bacterium]
MDSFAVAWGDAIPAPDESLPTRATLTATITPTGQIALDRAAAVPAPGAMATPANCDPAEPLIAAARQLILPLPPMIAIGSRWSDSTSTTVCRGGTPVTTGMVRDYQVEGLETVNGVRAVRISRRDTFTFAGASTAAPGQPITVSGRGSGAAIMHFDPSGGVYLGGTADSDFELTVRAGRSQTDFRQRVSSRTSLLAQ